MSPTRSKSRRKTKLAYQQLEVIRDIIFTNEKINTIVNEDLTLWCILLIDRLAN